MRKIIFLVLISIVFVSMSCQKNEEKIHSTLDSIDIQEYYTTEIFAQPHLNIYGKWKLYAISGGFSGGGVDLNFDYLEIRKYGVYGFTENGNLLEYGKIEPDPQTGENRLKVFFENADNSCLFIKDNEKYIDFVGNDTLNLNSPCCDRINYHFVREN